MKSTITIKRSNKATQGFTLIELVVVIVILGILAATVAPKYIDLTADAHTATLEAVKASLDGVSALVYSKSLVAGNQNESSASITLNDGDPLATSYGYPKMGLPWLASQYWKRLIELDNNFTLMINAGGILIIYPSHMEEPDGSLSPCIVTYKPSSGPNIAPIITVIPCI